MSPEVSVQELSRMREIQMIDAAVKRGFSADELEEYEAQAMKRIRHKKKPRQGRKAGLGDGRTNSKPVSVK